MTPEAQRIAIAEACGWKFWQNKYQTWVVTAPDGREKAMPGTPEDAITLGTLLADFGLPDYLSDLNAMHEAEKVLNSQQIDEYKHRLMGFVTAKERISQCATAAQRAEAFLRTLNLWEGAQ